VSVPCHCGWAESINPTLGNVAVALALNEALELVRLPLVLATVPSLYRWWSRIRGKR
jgi:hypothetical protein